jgi:RND family efflux transporter MFP subunit
VRRFLILLVLVCAGCEPAAEIVVEEQAVRPARIFRVSSEGVTVENQFVARVEAAQTVDVSFEVSGPLAELPVREGQTIDKGTQSVVDDAQALHDLRSVRLAQAREALEDARIVAPFDAYVARRYTDNYANVQAGDKIVRLNDLNEIHVVASVPESLAATGSADQLIGAHAVFPFRPDQRYPLTFRENLGEADAVAQTYEVTFAMPPPPNLQILPGMTATLELEMMAAEGEGRTMNIPTSALIADSDKRFIVWIYDPETQAVSKRTVEVGPAVGRGVAVVSGLANGELIVATGASQLQNGMKIRVLGDPLTEL